MLVLKLLIILIIAYVTDYSASHYLAKQIASSHNIDRQVKILCVGNSHTRDGISSELLGQYLSVPVAKYSYAGVNTFDRFAMIRHYFSQYPDKVRLVVYDVNELSFARSRNVNKTYTNLYPFMDNPEIDSHVKKCAGSRSEYYSRRIYKMLRFSPELRIFALSKLFKRSNNITKAVTVEEIERSINLELKEYEDISVNKENLACFEDTIRFVKEHGAILVLVHIPSTDISKKMRDPKNVEQILGMFRSYATINQNVIFLDFQEKYSHRYELFYDRTHLNSSGMALFTQDLANDIGKFL